MSRSLQAPSKNLFCAATEYSWKGISEVATPATTGALRAPVRAAVADEDGGTITAGTPFYGTLSPAGDNDLLAFTVVAGETYSVSLRGSGANALTDSFLGVVNGAGAIIAVDDDGGAGINSLLTFTAATSGTYYVYADSFDGTGAGDYRVDVRAESATPDVGDTFAAAAALTVNELVFGFIGNQPGPYTGFGDVDTYKITLEAGKYYTFAMAGGADYDTDPDSVARGELDTALALYDAAGNLVAFNDDNAFPSDVSSGIGFLATTSGTYYLDATAYAGQRGGYTLEAQEIELSSLDPLDSIRWFSANNIPTTDNVATVYFAAPGESFGETADDGTSPLPSFGWNDYEKQQVMAALGEFTEITGISYQITTDATNATFRLVTTESEQYGAYFYPRDPGYGTQQGIGAFNVLSGGWSLPGQASLQQGGYAFAVILHEFGHAHGLAHPHDNGGGSDIMVGVTGSDSRGIFDLNQGVYTVMSYNDAWETHPDGESPYTRATVGFGWSGSLSAFDIAALQERYGVHANAAGDTLYRLDDANATGTFYETIWDTGGTDEIRYDGTKNARIDLLAATLDYTPTGGGVVSFVDDVFGGFTIANGVTIENATGGAGDDVILGQAAANRLTGNAGNDVLMGRGGNDFLDGGAGADRLFGDDGDDRIVLDLADLEVQGGAGTDTLVLRGAATVNLGNFDTTQVAGGQIFGFEDVDASAAGAAVTVNGSQYNNRIVGSARNDTLNGGAGFDTIDGGDGNDSINGGADADRLDGGAGDDRIFYDAADTLVQGGAGTDTLLVRGAATVNLGNFSTTQIAGKSVFGFENVDASGSSSPVTLNGSQYNNTLIGGSGADTIRGGGGFDTLTGGGGADRFVFDASLSPAANRATITDFNVRQGDRIDLSGIDAIAGGADNAFRFVGNKAFSGAAGELHYRTDGGGYIVEGDTNGDRVADFAFTLNSTTTPMDNFFIL